MSLTSLRHLLHGRKPMTRAQQQWLEDTILAANLNCGSFHGLVEDRVGDFVFDIADATELVRGASAKEFAQALPHLRVIRQRAQGAMLGQPGYSLEEIHAAVDALVAQFGPAARAA